MQNPHNHRRVFAIYYAGSALTLMLFTALANYVVDPYSIFGVRTVAGLNAIKPRPEVMLSDIKFILGSRSQPQALILGNSRAEVGFDPRHPALQARGLRVFNAAIPGSGLEDATNALRRFIATGNIRVAIVGIDFLDFLSSPDPAPASPHALPESERDSLARIRVLALFSATALLDSIRTLQMQRNENPATLRTDGFNPMLDYREIAAEQGYEALFRQRAQESARNLAKQPHNLYVGGKRISPSFSALQELLRVARENNIDLKLVIYPYHLLLLMQFEEAGLWPLFERWKTDVAAISDEASAHGVHISLWDFACPDAYTAESIPTGGDRRTSMQWYWEGGHFKKELGDRVLGKVFGESDLADSDAFGFSLTSVDVDQINLFCRKNLALMRERNPSLARMATDFARLATKHE